MLEAGREALNEPYVFLFVSYDFAFFIVTLVDLSLVLMGGCL